MESATNSAAWHLQTSKYEASTGPLPVRGLVTGRFDPVRTKCRTVHTNLLNQQQIYTNLLLKFWRQAWMSWCQGHLILSFHRKTLHRGCHVWDWLWAVRLASNACLLGRLFLAQNIERAKSSWYRKMVEIWILEWVKQVKSENTHPPAHTDSIQNPFNGILGWTVYACVVSPLRRDLMQCSTEHRVTLPINERQCGEPCQIYIRQSHDD